jgi:hypothetical protein
MRQIHSFSIIPFAHIPYLLATRHLLLLLSFVIRQDNCILLHITFPFEPYRSHLRNIHQLLPLIYYSLDSRLRNPACPVSTAIPTKPSRLSV